MNLLTSISAGFNRVVTRKESTSSLADFARDWTVLTREGEALLGSTGWAVLRRYGRVVAGEYSGHYVSALPRTEVRALLFALRRGERVPVHLMHRPQSGSHECSWLSLAEGRLFMHYTGRTEPAE